MVFDGVQVQNIKSNTKNPNQKQTKHDNAISRSRTQITLHPTPKIIFTRAKTKTQGPNDLNHKTVLIWSALSSDVAICLTKT